MKRNLQRHRHCLHGHARAWKNFDRNRRAALLSEPGVFLVKPDQSIYYLFGAVDAVVRPNFTEMVQALDFTIKNRHPAKGEYTGAL